MWVHEVRWHGLASESRIGLHRSVVVIISALLLHGIHLVRGKVGFPTWEGVST